MKRTGYFFISLFSAVFFLASIAFAQDDGGGFVKRMMNRFKKEAPPAPARVEEPADFEPLEPPAPAPPAPAYPVPSDEGSMMESVDLTEPEAVTVETAAPAPAPFQPAVPVAPPSKEELIQEITESMEEDEEMLGIVQGFKRNTDESGNVYYTYLIGGVEKRLEDLDVDTLDNLSLRVRSEYNKLSSQRILEQLERLREMQRPPTPPPAPPRTPTQPVVPRAPSTYTPPQPPSTPPGPPRTPSTPSGPPRR